MSGEFSVSDNMLESLRATRPWVKFLAILGFIVCGLMALAALAVLGGAGGKEGPMASVGPALAVVYLLLVLLYFMPCLYLYKYAGAISRIAESGQAAMEDALARQKSFWKFMGILTAIVLVIEVIGILAAVFLGSMFGAHG